MSAHIPLRVERETRLIVTDDANDTYVLCIASKQPLAIGYEIVRAYNTHPALVSALEKCIRDFENMDENQPTDTGCIECTAGTVPNHLNTGRCGYHEAKVALRLARGEG